MKNTGENTFAESGTFNVEVPEAYVENVSELCDIAPIAIIALCESDPSTVEELLESLDVKMFKATDKILELTNESNFLSYESI